MIVGYEVGHEPASLKDDTCFSLAQSMLACIERHAEDQEKRVVSRYLACQQTLPAEAKPKL